MKRKFASDRCKSTAPEPVQALLSTQTAEHRLDHRLALAEDASGLRMLHHHTKRLTLLILGIAFDAPPVRRPCAAFVQFARKGQSPQVLAPYT